MDFEAASVIDEMAEPIEQIVLDDDLLDQRKREIKAQNQKEDWFNLIQRLKRIRPRSQANMQHPPQKTLIERQDNERNRSCQRSQAQFDNL